MKTVCITGAQGFIGSYLCKDLLDAGYHVIGIDNYSKYGKIARPHDNHPNFTFYEEDVVGIEKRDLLRFQNVDAIIAIAAKIGGISYFHKYAYDLLAENERIMASTFDLAISLKKLCSLKRIVVLSSSMVYENATNYPTEESEIKVIPPPDSTYGFQKLACEYFCKGAFEQYGLEYTILRPFNCVGVGEEEALGEEAVMSGGVKLMMSHVLPDIINKIMQNQYPLRIFGDGNQIRCYTNGKDIARGIRLAMESPKAINEDFNISIERATSVLELAKIAWKILKPSYLFWHEEDAPFQYDVQKRIPSIQKAKNVLEFEAKIPLEESILEVIEYVKQQQTRNLDDTSEYSRK